MGTPIRVVNAFYAALFIVAALATFWLVVSNAGLDPWLAAPWLPLAWLALTVLPAALCFANLRGARRPWRAAANVAALLAAGAWLLSAEEAMRWLGGVAAVPFAVTLLGWRAGRAQPPGASAH